MANEVTLLINGRPHVFQSDIVGPDELRNAIEAPADYEVWRVVRNPDPEGDLPVDDEQVVGPIGVKSGDRFRVLPPGTFGA